MPIGIAATAICKCAMGTIPSPFMVLPVGRMVAESKPVGNIMDNILGVNFPTPVGTFGQCMSLANPATATATALAFGVLTPMPCTPVFPAPWVPGALKVLGDGVPILDNTSMLMCAYAGVITPIFPGEVSLMLS